MPRKYDLKARAERQEATRKRIVEAIARLHASVGPAATTVSAIATEAGVERLTVYRHFPTVAEMVKACGAHWRSLHPRPNSDAWLEIADPLERFERALAEIYRFYDETEGMTSNILRDEVALPELAEVANFRGWFTTITERICDAWPPEKREKVQPAVRLAVDFHSWELLIRRLELEPEAAISLVRRLVSDN